MGAVLWILMLVPPFSEWARRYEFAQALQFVTFAYWVPALVIIGAPWQRLGLASADGSTNRFIDRVARTRSRLNGFRKAVAVAVLFGVMTVLWRVAPVVDAMTTSRVIVVAEALTLTLAGLALLSSLIDSPPMTTGVTRPARIGISAVVMWTIWVVAYLNGMSHDSWYHDFHHVAGQGISLVADQQLSAGILWFASAGVFVPIVFTNLMKWLQNEEDPDDELYSLVRQERTRGFFGSY